MLRDGDDLQREVIKRKKRFSGMQINSIPPMGGGGTFSTLQMESLSSFIKPDDRLPAWFAIAAYQQLPPPTAYGFTIVPRLTTSRIVVWQRCNLVMIALRGTQVGGRGGAKDMLDDFNIADQPNTCELSLTAEGARVIQNLEQNGVTEIWLSGHSLGGRAALCLGSHNKVTKVVALNAGAPIVGPVTSGPGPQKATHYHIMGDAISTHVYPEAAEIIRVRVKQDINWVDSYYHSTDRFFGGEWNHVTASQEQEDFEQFFLFKGVGILTWISWGSSIAGAPFLKKVRMLICERPIPGAQTLNLCKSHTGFGIGSDKVNRIVHGIAGALFGAVMGFVTGGPIGIITGAIAGGTITAAAYDGDIRKLLEEYIPGYEKISTALKDKAVEIFRKAAKLNADPYTAVAEVADEVLG